MENITNDKYNNKLIDLKKIFSLIYKKNPTSKIKFDYLTLKKLDNKTESYKISDYKNTRDLLYYLFANINKKPFINSKYNPYAFEILWIILDVLNIEKNKNDIFKKKNIFVDIEQYSREVINLIKPGKYIINIPKYKKYVFDVKNKGLAKLSII